MLTVRDSAHVLRVDTGWVLALVVQVHPVRDGAVCFDPCIAVRETLAVAVFVGASVAELVPHAEKLVAWASEAPIDDFPSLGEHP